MNMLIMRLEGESVEREAELLQGRCEALLLPSLALHVDEDGDGDQRQTQRCRHVGAEPYQRPHQRVAHGPLREICAHSPTQSH